MKLRPVNVVEVVVSVLFIIAHFLKGLLPYAGLITAICGGILGFLYLNLSKLTLKSPNIRPGYIMLYGYIFSVAVIGILYSFNSWPFGKFFITLGITLFVLLALIRLIAVNLLKKPQVIPYSKDIVVRYLLLFAFLVYAFVTYKFK